MITYWLWDAHRGCWTVVTTSLDVWRGYGHATHSAGPCSGPSTIAHLLGLPWYSPQAVPPSGDVGIPMSAAMPAAWVCCNSYPQSYGNGDILVPIEATVGVHQLHSVPEPAAIAMFAVGVLALVLFRRKRKA